MQYKVYYPRVYDRDTTLEQLSVVDREESLKYILGSHA